MLTRFFSVCVMCLLAASLRGEDTVIVTASEVPLLDAAGEAVAEAAFHDVLEVTGEDGDYWLVQQDGQALKVHRGMGYRLSELSYANDQSKGPIHLAFMLLEKAARAADEGEYERAIEFAQEAATAAALDQPQPTALQPWVQQYEAWLNCQLGNFERAHELLDTCEATLQQINQTRHPHAADVYNSRAIAYDGQGLTQQAIDAYQQALLIALSEVGANHHDTAVIADNLSITHEAAGDVAQAVFPQQLVVQIKQKILPAGNLNVVLAYDRLAALLRDLERWDQSLQQYEIVKDLYLQHHPHSKRNLGDVRANIVYCRTENEDYAGAEVACEESMLALDEMSAEDPLHFRKDTLLRMGTIDFRQEQYQPAMAHYREAAELADPFNYELQDGHAHEHIGDVYVQLEDTTKAKEAYEQAIDVYAQTEGADSEEVLVLREYSDTLDSYRDESLNGVVQVATPRGYLRDDEGNVVTTVPGLSVLAWFSSNDEFHEVQYEGKVHRIYNSDLSTKRLLPGYGVTKADTFRSIMNNVAASLEALQEQDISTAKLKLQIALEECEQQPGTENSLYLWLKIMQAGVLLRTDGIAVATELLAEVEAAVQESNPAGFPLMVNFHNVHGAILLEQGDAEEAASQYRQARDLAVERYGQQHAITLNTIKSYAKALFESGNADEALAEFRSALQVSEEIYPAGKPEITEIISDLSIALTQSGKLADAAELLEIVLEGEHNLPRDVHVMLVATLGKVYAGLDRPADARQLLEAVVNAVNSDGEQAVNSPRGLLGYIELGKLDLAEEKWQQAEKNLRQAVSIIGELDMRNNFEASEVHRQLAVALQQQKNFKAAQAQLIEVMRIYDFLGGADSPQAQEIRDLQQELATAAMQPHGSPATSQATSESLAPLLALINLTPDHEVMLITKAEANVVDLPQQSAPEITKLPAETKVWSLEARDGYHRIYLPEQAQFGWIANDDVHSHRSVLEEKGRLYLQEKLSDKPATALQECLVAFDQATSARETLDPQAAIPAIEKSLATIESHFPRSNALSGLLYQDLLEMHSAPGQPMSASTAEEGLSDLLSGPGYDHPSTAEVRMIKAAHYRALGNWPKEGSELNEVLKTCRKRFGPQDARTRSQMLAAASNEVRRGFFDNASKIYEELLTTSPEHPDAVQQQAESLIQAAAYLGKGTLAASVSGSPFATPDLQSAVDGFGALSFTPPSLIVGAINALSSNLADQKEYSKAGPLLQQAASIPLSPDDHVVRLATLTLQSRVAMLEGLDQAAQLASNAMELVEQNYGAEHFLMHDPVQALGRASVRGDMSQAVQAFEKARRLVGKYVQEQVMFQSSTVSMSFAGADRKSLDEAVSIAFVDGGEAAAEDSVEWLINGQNLLVDALAWPRKMMARATDVKDQQNLILWHDKRGERADLPLKVQTPAMSPEVQSAVQKLQNEEQPYFAKLPGDMKVAVEPSPWVTCAQLRENLRPDEVLIVFRSLSNAAIPYDDFYFDSQPFDNASAPLCVAWIIPGDTDEKVQAVTLIGQDVVNERVDRALGVMRDIANQRGSVSNAAVQEEQERLKELAAVVWEPLAKRLPAGTTHLTFCPDGILHGVPWVALPDSKDAPLIESFTVRQLLSPRSLLKDDSPYPEHSAEDSRPLIFSQPEAFGQDPALADFSQAQLQFFTRQTASTKLPFDKRQLIKATRANASLVDELLSQAGENGRRNQNANQQDKSEGQRIAEVLGTSFGSAAQVLEGVSASELQYFQRHPRLLHISAPVFAAQPQRVERSAPFAASEARALIAARDKAAFNPLMNCGVMLAGYNVIEALHALNDGVLTGEEVVSQDLRGTQLVTLSRAATSPHDGELDPAAVHLLPQAFLEAGAAAVVSSVWSMQDAQTTELLTAFYTQLAQGQPAAAALRTAQLQIRATLQTESDAVPAAVWASFRVTGEGWKVGDADNTAAEVKNTKPVPSSDDALVVAELVLKAYGNKDLKQLLSLTSSGPPSQETLQEYGPGTSRYNSLFGEQSWRWQAVSEWNKKFTIVYYQKKRQASSAQTADTAHVQFGQNDSEIYVVTLEKTDDGWKFEDIHSPSADGLKNQALAVPVEK